MKQHLINLAKYTKKNWTSIVKGATAGTAEGILSFLQIQSVIDAPFVLYSSYHFQNIQYKRAVLEMLRPYLADGVYEDISHKLDLLEEQTVSAAINMWWNSVSNLDKSKGFL